MKLVVATANSKSGSSSLSEFWMSNTLTATSNDLMSNPFKFDRTFNTASKPKPVNCKGHRATRRLRKISKSINQGILTEFKGGQIQIQC